MIRSLYIPKEGLPQWDLPVAAISGALADPDGLLWVSLEKPSADEIKLVLADLFHFHPLAIEDTQSVGYQTPKVDDYGAYLFMVILAVMENQNPDELLSEECDIFLGQNYVVSTYHGDRMPAVDKLRQRLQREQRLLGNG
jgi:magnesium transporter